MSVTENHFKDEFVSLWNNKVKALAEKCAETYPTMARIENGEQLPEDDPEVLKIKALHDVNATWYVGLMIGDINRAIIHGIRLNVLNSIGQVHAVLRENSTYWPNVWNNDFSSEEAKNLKALAEGMEELVTKL